MRRNLRPRRYIAAGGIKFSTEGGWTACFIGWLFSILVAYAVVALAIGAGLTLIIDKSFWEAFRIGYGVAILTGVGITVIGVIRR